MIFFFLTTREASSRTTIETVWTTHHIPDFETVELTLDYSMFLSFTKANYGCTRISRCHGIICRTRHVQTNPISRWNEIYGSHVDISFEQCRRSVHHCQSRWRRNMGTYSKHIECQTHLDFKQRLFDHVRTGE